MPLPVPPAPVAQIAPADLDPALDNFVTGAGTPLDASLTFGTGSITVASVPEPSPLTLLALAVGCLIIHRRARLAARL